MTKPRSLPAMLLLALPTVAAWAQTAAVAPPQEPESAARVQRDAGNPLRMIIEAGKLKVRPKGQEADSAPKRVADKPLARAPGAKPAEASGAALAGSLATTRLRPDAATGPAAQPSAAGAVAGTTPVAGTAPVPGATAVAATTSVAPTTPVAGTTPGVATPAALAALLGTSAAALVTPARTVPVRLELADYVEPVLPERLRSRLRGTPEVVLDLMVRADGSVGEATVRSSTDKALEPLALAAVRQWRYKRIDEPRAHAVQLVFPQ